MIFWTILIFLVTLLFIRRTEEQSGGWNDPYAWIRPWRIVDFFRNFWLTR